MRARRLFLGKRIKDVARELGVSTVAISRWENGYMQPSMKRLVHIARAYECDVKSILTETGRAVWSHFETVLLEHVMAQASEMEPVTNEEGEIEPGQLPNMDMAQFMSLAERLGVFTEVEEVDSEETEAQEQMLKEIR